MLSIREALDAMMARFDALPAERVPLERALGRVLARPLTAREDVPGFDNSAMDGYAVRARDLEAARADAPVALPLEGESRAGGPAPAPLRERAAMRIFTGAPLPAGADAVVMQEDVEVRRGTAVFRAPTATGKHVRRRAEVLAAGDALLEPGTLLGVGEIGLLASQGLAEVPVHRRPKVALLTTGDELRDLGEAPRPGTLVDSNVHALAAAVREAGGVPIVLPRARDDRGELARAVAEGIASSDVFVSCGGVSVGDYDLLHEVFAELGVAEVFWKVRIKPGKPLRFGVAGRVPVVGLPGNPVSALLTFEIFVRPGLRRMLGDRAPHRRTIEVELARAMRAPDARTELVRARLEPREGAPPLALPHPDQGSGALTSLVGLDALVVLEEGSGEHPAGARLRAIDLRSYGSSSPAF